MSDLNNEFQHLRQLLVKLKYRKTISVERICDGFTSELLPLLHYGLLSYSADLARDISQAGYDLFGKNDLRFTECVYSLCRNYFGYNPVLQCHQFLTEKGFAHRKMAFVAQVLECCLLKHKNLIKAKEKKSRKVSWSDTKMSQKVDSAIADSKKKARREREEKHRNDRKSNPHLRSIKAKTKRKRRTKSPSDQNADSPPPELNFGPSIQADASWEARSPPVPTSTTTLPAPIVDGVEEKSDEAFVIEPRTRSNESMIETQGNLPQQQQPPSSRIDPPEHKEATYNPNNYIQPSNATMELSNPDLNPYLHMQPLVDRQVRSSPDEDDETDSHSSNADPNDARRIGLPTINESQSFVSPDEVRTDSTDESAPPAPHEDQQLHSHVGGNEEELVSLRSIVNLLQAMSSRIDRLEERCSKIDQVEARLVVMEGRIRYFEQQKENVPPRRREEKEIDDSEHEVKVSSPSMEIPRSKRRNVRAMSSHSANGYHRSSSSSPTQTIGSSPIPVSSVSSSRPAPPRPRSSPPMNQFPHIPSWMAPAQPLTPFVAQPPIAPSFDALGHRHSSSGTPYSVARLHVPVTSSSGSPVAVMESSSSSSGGRSNPTTSNSSITGFIQSLQSRLDASERLLESTRPRSPFS